jgi:hypothetical protein
MATAFEMVVELFKERNWDFELDAENQRVQSVIVAENGAWRFIVSAAEEQKLCFVLSVLPQKCPEQRRRLCAELLSRINCSLMLGCFEMDFETGRIQFKTSYPFVTGQFDAELFQTIIGFNFDCLDKFIPAIMAVINGGVSPIRAIAAVQHDKTQEIDKRKPNQSGLSRRYSAN